MAAFSATARPSAGLAMVMTGGVVSMFTGGEVNVLLFPATSVTVTDAVTPVPSILNSSGLPGDAVATPEWLSAVVKGMDTAVLCQPAAFAAGIGASKVSV